MSVILWTNTAPPLVGAQTAVRKIKRSACTLLLLVSVASTLYALQQPDFVNIFQFKICVILRRSWSSLLRFTIFRRFLPVLWIYLLFREGQSDDHCKLVQSSDLACHGDWLVPPTLQPKPIQFAAQRTRGAVSWGPRFFETPHDTVFEILYSPRISAFLLHDFLRTNITKNNSLQDEKSRKTTWLHKIPPLINNHILHLSQSHQQPQKHNTTKIKNMTTNNNNTTATL